MIFYALFFYFVCKSYQIWSWKATCRSGSAELYLDGLSSAYLICGNICLSIGITQTLIGLYI